MSWKIAHHQAHQSSQHNKTLLQHFRVDFSSFMTRQSLFRRTMSALAAAAGDLPASPPATGAIPLHAGATADGCGACARGLMKKIPAACNSRGARARACGFRSLHQAACGGGGCLDVGIPGLQFDAHGDGVEGGACTPLRLRIALVFSPQVHTNSASHIHVRLFASSIAAVHTCECAVPSLVTTESPKLPIISLLHWSAVSGMYWAHAGVLKASPPGIKMKATGRDHWRSLASGLTYTVPRTGRLTTREHPCLGTM